MSWAATEVLDKGTEPPGGRFSPRIFNASQSVTSAIALLNGGTTRWPYDEAYVYSTSHSEWYKLTNSAAPAPEPTPAPAASTPKKAEISDRLSNHLAAQRDQFNKSQGITERVPAGEAFSDGYQYWPSKAKAGLGSGNFGSTYRVKSTRSDAIYAAKVIDIAKMKQMKITTDKVEKEARTLKALDHGNIVKYHRCFYDDLTDDRIDDFVIVLEYCGGGTLEAQVQKHSPLPLGQVTRWLKELCTGLDYMHSGGCGQRMIHRDMKCDNVLLDDNGVVKITDLGLATTASFMVSQQGMVTYASKQKVMGAPFGGDDDMWAVGAMVTELVTGQLCTDNRALNRAPLCMRSDVVGQIIRATTSKSRELGRLAQELLRIDDAHRRPSAAICIRALEAL